jgi:hypothetical protein
MGCSLHVYFDERHGSEEVGNQEDLRPLTLTPSSIAGIQCISRREEQTWKIIGEFVIAWALLTDHRAVTRLTTKQVCGGKCKNLR